MSALDKALDRFANFVLWESQQAWKEDYDRKANIANSRNISKQAIKALMLELVGQNERAGDQPHECYESYCEECISLDRDSLRAELRKAIEEL